MSENIFNKDNMLQFFNNIKWQVLISLDKRKLTNDIFYKILQNTQNGIKSIITTKLKWHLTVNSGFSLIYYIFGK